MFVVPLAVAVVFLAACWGFCRMTRDPERPSLARLADPRPLPGERPFPVDTGPLLLSSEMSSAWEALEREQRGWSA